MHAAESEKIVFKFLGGPRKDDIASFQQANISIGRAAGSDLLFHARDYSTVSSHHAVVRYHDFGFELTDAHSTNGTFINGERTYRMVLKNGDIIRLGKLGPELEVIIPSDVSELTVMENVPTGMTRKFRGSGSEASLTDPEVSEKILRLRHLRFVRKIMFLALGTAAGFSGFAWTLIEGLQLSPAPLYFKSAMSLIMGGVLVALVFAIYHGRPGKQRFRVSEILWIALIVALSIGGVLLLWSTA
jgi:hypothetical protein